MEKKINVAELLKDCPSGMELDCTIWNSEIKVFLKEVRNDDFTYPIVVTIKDNNIEYSHSFTKYGAYNDYPYCKCVIFPKGKTTWEGFVPPCQFKDGDIITNPLGTCIFKREGKIKGTVDYYCGISSDSDCFSVKDNKCRPDGHYGNIVAYRLATEEEKQKLFQAIKDNGYKWNEETKTLEKLPKFKVGDTIKGNVIISATETKSEKLTIIEIKSDGYILEGVSGEFSVLPFVAEDYWELVPSKFAISTLKPFDKVLVRLTKDGVWNATFFSHYDKEVKWGCYPFVTTSSKSYSMCIPYEQNKHLLGTTDDCDEFYKTWK